MTKLTVNIIFLIIKNILLLLLFIIIKINKIGSSKFDIWIKHYLLCININLLGPKRGFENPSLKRGFQLLLRGQVNVCARENHV